MAQKRIGLIIAYPESTYQQRVLDAACSVCEEYGFDLIVFTMLVQSCHYFKDYLEGELDIYDLINFDELDAVLVSPISLTENDDNYLLDRIRNMVHEKCDKPVAALDLEFDGRYTAAPDDTVAFEAITEHMIDVHGARNIYFMTGVPEHEVSERRLRGFKNVLARRGMKFDKNKVFPGDFWYTGGEQLADRIASGELEKPDAVICASDHMAIGLCERLKEHGISVPQDVAVTGYDATIEAAANEPALTTYVPEVRKAVHKAVNYLIKEIDSGAELIEPHGSDDNGMRICASCGCPENIPYIKSRLFSSLWVGVHNFGKTGYEDMVDVSKFLDSYSFEKFTSASDLESGLKEIYAADWLIRPYSNFWLCLDPDWLDTEKIHLKGYPEQMNIVIHTVPTDTLTFGDGQHLTLKNDHLFETRKLLPYLHEEHEPSVFYFVPMHFSNVRFGYAVLQCPVGQKHKISVVFHNWVRNVGNALEMIRSKNKLMMLADRDIMTGLYNRRGMEQELEKTAVHADGDEWLVYVIDMDGLKYINDNFGHLEGDFGLKMIASAVMSIARVDDICVRAGGDEFYIIGRGAYDEAQCRRRYDDFIANLDAMSHSSGKEYPILASIGFAHGPLTRDIDDVLSEADVRMYESKLERQRHRK
ncbi:MAG: GGDEF domain-containing protein [Oscillospiraceae bacterium]|nr:GGDEF domain-containing protein [Oscillospiraceae bacterium]